MVRTAVRKECISLKTENKVRFLALSAVIAALYAVLTYAAAAVNLAYGPFQFRFSEALTVLPAFTPAAIPGLAVGCLLSNLASPLGIVDWVFGTLATLLAACCTYMLRNVKWKEIPILAPLPPVIFNALIIPLLIPLALRGVTYKPIGASALLRRNLFIYGLGGVIVPFVGIKLIDMLVSVFF